jgi:spermidine/putrescine transport system substrate-binding protein
MKKRKIVIYIFSIILAFSLIIPSFYRVLILRKPEFVLANWENYMDPKLQNDIQKQYGLQVTNYGTNSDLIGQYSAGTYDIAFPSTFIMEKLAKANVIDKVEWSNFGFNNINNSKDAEILFSNTFIKFNNIYKQKRQFNLLDYGIPYFGQDLVFTYRGEYLKDFCLLENDKCVSDRKDMSWTDIMESIIKNKNFFKNSLSILNDEKNIFSISKSLNSNCMDYNEEDDPDLVLSGLKKYLSQIGTIIWTSDSNRILNNLASNSINGAILYNGDALYSSYGGDSKIEDIDQENFHFIRPAKTMTAFDFITFSKKISDSKKEKLYNLISQIAFFNSVKQHVKISNQSNDLISLKNAINDIDYFQKEESYKYWSLQNFNTVNYYSPLSIFESEKNNILNKYFENDTWRYDIYNITKEQIVPNYIETPITDKQSLELSLSFARFKNSL